MNSSIAYRRKRSAKPAPSALACMLSLSLIGFGVPAAFADDAADEPVAPAAADSPATSDGAAGAPSENASADASAAVSDGAASAADVAPTPSAVLTDEEIAQVLGGAPADTAELGTNSSAAASGLLARGGNGVMLTSFAGDTAIETAVAEADAAYPEGSKSALLVGPGEAWIDVLSAAGLAGSLGPILFTASDELSAATLAELQKLGVEKAVLVGGPSSVSPAVANALEANGIASERVFGQNAYDTQMALYRYGLERNLWGGGTIIVSTATSFGDALSVSPVAFAERAPIFLVDESGELSSAQKKALVEASKTGLFKNSALVGGALSVTEETEGFLRAVSFAGGGVCERLAGDDQYGTSAAIATWAVESRGFSWDRVAFATGETPYDALAGSVLQGTSRSVLLLVTPSHRFTISVAAAHKDVVNEVRVFGGTFSVPQSVRTAILLMFGDQVQYEDTGITFEHMLELEDAADENNQNYYTTDEIREFLDPDSSSPSDASFYQFAALNQGYSGAVTAEQLDAFIDAKCAGAEARYGVTSKLRGAGKYFIEAARRYNVNEVYLLCHAALESAWGCSRFAQGAISDYEGYYNFFGIKCYDSDPIVGAAYAKEQGWDTVEKAVIGAAEWISEGIDEKGGGFSGGYLNNRWDQNTLYKMKWNYRMAAKENSVWFQYATARHWAVGIARIMGECYAMNGIDQAHSGLGFLVPRYA